MLIKILKMAYNTVSNFYTNDKSQIWARLGMRITYCMTIDKIYLPHKFYDSFQQYFKWSKEGKEDYVSALNF